MNTQKEKINYIADYCKLQGTCIQFAEEAGELLKVIGKLNRLDGIGLPVASDITKEKVLNDLKEEVTDVSIVIDELIHLIGESQIDEIRKYKIDRTINRLKGIKLWI